MNVYHDRFPVKMMARVLGVSCSGYYAWRNRGTSDREKDRIEFDAIVNRAFHREKRRSGRNRLTAVLRRQGIPCGRKRVARSLARQKLRIRRVRKYVTTTDSRHKYAVAPNLLNREFTTEKPNLVWVTDITYLPCKAGWLYLVIFLDLFSRRIVGWSVGHSLRHEPVILAFDRAIERRHPARGLIVHSDRGIQYCCTGFTEHMRIHGVRQSMSRKGDCWDNAVAESFFASLKKDLASIDITTFETKEHAERVLFEYIEVDYNRHRLHSTLGYLTPVEFEDEKGSERT